jgi:hypothetical protein
MQEGKAVIHRLALLMGGTGAAGVLAVAVALGGFGSPLSNSPDAFVPVSNDALAGGQRAAEGPTDQPTMTTSLGGGSPEAPKKVIDTVYVLPVPAPAVDRSGKPADDANQPGDKPRDPADDNNGGNNAGDDNGGNQAGEDEGDDSSADEDEGPEDQASEDDGSNDADQSDEGGEDTGGYETGDD